PPYFDQSLPAHLIADATCLPGRPLVAADDCRANRLAAAIDEDAAGLAGQSEATDLAPDGRGDAGQDLERGTAPICGILFEPARPRGGRPIFRKSGRNGCPGRIEGN